MIKTAIKSSLPGIQRMIKCNDLFKHYKGGMYKVITVAKDTETEKDHVIYYDVNKPDDKPWSRPLDMFNDYVIIEHSSPTNTLIGSTELPKPKLRFEQVVYI